MSARGTVAATFILIAASAGVARADMPVVDWTAIAKAEQEIGNLEEQLITLRQQYEQIIQLYTQTVGILNSVSGVVNPEQWATDLESDGQHWPLPGVGMMPSVAGGMTDLSTLPYGSWYQSQNTVPGFTNDGSPAAATIFRGMRSIAGLMSIATNNIAALQRRAEAIPELETQLSAASTVQQTTAIGARLQAEQNYVGAQAAAAANLHTTAELQVAAMQNQDQQRAYQDEAQGIADGCARIASLGTGVTIPSCSTSSGSPSTGSLPGGVKGFE